MDGRQPPTGSQRVPWALQVLQSGVVLLFYVFVAIVIAYFAYAR
jgi:hypothetical protein